MNGLGKNKELIFHKDDNIAWFNQNPKKRDYPVVGIARPVGGAGMVELSHVHPGFGAIFRLLSSHVPWYEQFIPFLLIRIEDLNDDDTFWFCSADVCHGHHGDSIRGIFSTHTQPTAIVEFIHFQLLRWEAHER